MARALSRRGLFFSLLRLAIIGVVTVELQAFTTIKLPGIDDFRHGLDYSTGQRKKSIFTFTYKNAEAGAANYLHFAPLDELTYQIPDQVDAMNWASVCTSLSSTKSTSHSSFRSFQESESKSVNSGFDQKTDIGVSVPVGPAEVSMSTQTRNNLGYGKSSASSDFASAMLSGQRTAASITTLNSRWAVQWKSFDKNLHPVAPKNHLTFDFQGAVNFLKSVCTKGAVDMAWRMEGNTGSGTSACEHAAGRLVEDFGTHYNGRAEYGGKASQSYFYNEDQMSNSQVNNMEENSKLSMGFLFFSRDEETTKGRQEVTSMKTKKVVSESKLRIVGGNAGASTAGAWCNTVSKAPTIIGNSRVIPIAELIEEGSLARTAALFAGMDKWICNGRGSYVNISPSTGEGRCKCQSDASFYLDAFCAPQSPKCYSGSKVVVCQFEKILATYTLSYSLLWNDRGSGGRNDGSLYKPNVAANKALVGTVAVKGYSSPTKPVITIDTSTSFAVARPASRFYKLWGDHGTGSDRDGSVYRAVCPGGYTSISDFGQKGYNWPVLCYVTLRNALRISLRSLMLFNFVLVLLLLGVHSSIAQDCATSELSLWVKEASIPSLGEEILSDWNSPDPCTWKGVTCNGGCFDKLDLTNFGLSLFEDPTCDAFSLVCDIFSDPSDPTNFDELLLGGNTLMGTWPSIPDFNSIVAVDLSNHVLERDNHLLTVYEDKKGEPVVNPYEHLRSYKCDGCNLVGTIPEDLDFELKGVWAERYPALEKLSLSGSKMVGELPAGWGSWSSLRVLDLSNNDLRGTIPESWGKLTNIELVDLSGNDNLSSEIPKEWAKRLTCAKDNPLRCEKKNS
ncbi:hypothetical protein BSKO_04657 [Bryopsis sp. KO-2023]|nr:hypothetical protein BSKO_04657 [Bryopsis sp. KO-2023]